MLKTIKAHGKIAVVFRDKELGELSILYEPKKVVLVTPFSIASELLENGDKMPEKARKMLTRVINNDPSVEVGIYYNDKP